MLQPDHTVQEELEGQLRASATLPVIVACEPAISPNLHAPSMPPRPAPVTRLKQWPSGCTNSDTKLMPLVSFTASLEIRMVRPMWCQDLITASELLS